MVLKFIGFGQHKLPYIVDFSVLMVDVLKTSFKKSIKEIMEMKLVKDFALRAKISDQYWKCMKKENKL